jgi:serine/threonine-protein kinase
VLHRDQAGQPDARAVAGAGRAGDRDRLRVCRARGRAKLTARGHVVGSLTNLAPERLKGRPADPRSDLYAIGIILYELIAGRAPFIGADDFELISAHLHDDPPPLDLVAPTPPPEPVARLVMQALAKEPDHRFASALAMAAAIEDASRSIATAG